MLLEEGVCCDQYVLLAKLVSLCPFPAVQEKTTHVHHQMDNAKIRSIMFFAAEDGEALYSKGKQDLELIVAQIMHVVLQNSDLN